MHPPEAITPWIITIRPRKPIVSLRDPTEQLLTTDAGWRLPDLAWGAEAWAVLRVTVPSGALPPAGQFCAVLRAAVTGQSLEGDAVSLERAGLSLPVMNTGAFDNLANDELVTRRLVELAAAEALMGMRSAAAANDWPRVDALLDAASRRFAGNEQATTPRKSTHPRSDFRRAPQVVHHFAGASPCLSAKSVTTLPNLNAAGCTACHSHMQKRAALMVWYPDPRNAAWTLSPRPQHFPTSVPHGLVHGASVGA